VVRREHSWATGRARAWRYQSPLGKRVRLGAVLREAVNSYDPSAASLSGTTSAALDECDQLELRRLDSGDLRPVSTGEDFATDSLLAALADRDSETELQMILEVALPERDWVWAHLYWHVHLGRASHAGQSEIDCASTTSFGPAICIAGFTFAPRHTSRQKMDNQSYPSVEIDCSAQYHGREVA
jgi:hypothetical protein